MAIRFQTPEENTQDIVTLSNVFYSLLKRNHHDKTDITFSTSRKSKISQKRTRKPAISCLALKKTAEI